MNRCILVFLDIDIMVLRMFGVIISRVKFEILLWMRIFYGLDIKEEGVDLCSI